MGLAELVEHFTRQVRALAAPPVLIARPWRRLDLFSRRSFARDFANCLP